MEHQAEFDLNRNIANWRAGLAGSPAVRPESLEEMESHLRDSVNALEAQGLSLEEAFLIAVRRIGAPQELEQEFAKVGLGRVWMSRAMWAAIGLTLINIVDAMTRFFSACGIALLGPAKLDFSPVKIFPGPFTKTFAWIQLDLGLRVAVLFGAFVLLRSGIKYRASAERISKWLSHPSWLVLGLLILQVMTVILRIMLPFALQRGVEPERLVITSIINTYAGLEYGFLQACLVSFASIYLVRRHFKKTRMAGGSEA